MKPRQRGAILIDALIGLFIVGAVVTTLNYAYRFADHYTSVWGTVAGFVRMHEAERAYRRAGYTGPIDYTVMQVLMPGVRVHSSTSAHRNGVGKPYELRLDGTEQVLTTLVDNEAQASQIVQKLAGKAAYVAEANGFRISFRLARVDPLEQLIQRHSMHVSGPHGSHLKDRLNFGSGAIVTVGDPCLPPDGVHSGGIAIDARGHPVTCVRIATGTSVPDREWRLVPSGSSPPTPPPQLTEYCGDGTPVSSRSDDCKDCPDGTNIPIADSCPSSTIQRCGDGTGVVDRETECQDCWDGTNIPVVDFCPAQPTEQCGDGTYVFDMFTECQDCWDGTNIHVDDSCPPDPVFEYCGDGTIVSDPSTDCKDCSDGSNIPINAGCPPDPFLEYCGDGTIVSDVSTDCKDCWNGTNIPISTACPQEPVVHYCGDGTPVADPLTECQNCQCGENIHVDDTCPLPPDQCGDGTRVCNAATDCQDCSDGSNIHISATCPLEPIAKYCGDLTEVTDRATECKDCCDGTNVHITAICPLEVDCWDNTKACAPDVCPVQPECGDGTLVNNRATDCKDCWDSSNIAVTSSCPVQPSCGDGTLVTDRDTECKDCCDGNNIAATKDCPATTYSCSDTSASYPNCCCSTMTPIETQNECKIVLSCPAKPTIGVPISANPGPNWVIIERETECFIERTLVCVGSQGTCFGPSNYCSNVIQVWYGGGSVCTSPNQECGNSHTGFICGESTFGP